MTYTNGNNARFIYEEPNAKAIVKTLSWLQAAKIPVEKQGQTLKLTKKTGGHLLLSFPITEGEFVEGHMNVLVSKVVHRDPVVAMATFHTITEAAGYGKPIPIDRGAPPSKKLNYKTDFELVAMRHCEFRRVPDPDPKQLEALRPTIEKAINRAFYKNKPLCAIHQLDRQDLQSYALIWTSNYLGLYQVLDSPVDNARKLYSHLCQRFGGFMNLLRKNHVTSPQYFGNSAAIESINHSSGRDQKERRSDIGPIIREICWNLFSEEQEVDFTHDYKEAPPEALPATRKRLAKAKLVSKFKEMNHDALRSLLGTAARDEEPDVRKEALRQLKKLDQECVCKTCSEPKRQGTG